jgi:hypothetical protein
MIKKLNPKHLKRLLNNECDVIIYREGLSEDGEPLEALIFKNRRCRFVEETKVLIDSDGRKIELVGKIILLGDASLIEERKYTVKELNLMSLIELNSQKVKLKTKKQKVKKISGGQVSVNDCTYEIYRASKPRNPDGTVYMTVLELM